MARRVVILGGGSGGTVVANRLRRRFPHDDPAVTVVDADDRHVYQPGLLLVPFGMARPERLVRSRRSVLSPGITFVEGAVDRVDTAANRVHLVGGNVLDYDVLVVATGLTLAMDETPGLTGPGWMDKVFTFYTPTGAAALGAALAGFEGGRIVMNVVDNPIKCPVTPLEFCFLADWYFHRRGIRRQVQLVYATPMDAAFTKPVAARALAGILEEKGVELVTDFNTATVDGAGGRLVSYDERDVPFDLAVVVPLQQGPAYVGRSPGLGDEMGFVPTDHHTLQAKVAPNVFALGDGADLPTSKTGSGVHFSAGTVVDNIAHYLAGQPVEPTYDGHSNCFIEAGYGRALLIDFNYDTEPLPGHYPGPVGLPLLRRSRLNHLGKRMFEPLYWHAIVPGRDIPGLSATMPMAGKRRPAA